MGVRIRMLIALAAILVFSAPGVYAEPADVSTIARSAEVESQRLQRAKDLIADENWARAITELRAAVADPNEPNKDEALFWLAHSLYDSGDAASALDTIRQLEDRHAKSRWVRPARSLRVEIAQRLGRTDVLWWVAVPPPPPAPPTPHAPPTPRAPAAAPPLPPAPPGVAAPPSPVKPGMRAFPAPPPPPPGWMPAHYEPDLELQIQALGGLMMTDPAASAKVMPILRDIAFRSPDPAQAQRALFVLGRSNRPEARTMVMEVAKNGAEPAQLAAVRVMGSFHGPEVSDALLQVYSHAGAPVKFQVVTSLGERAAAVPLMRILQSEADLELQETTIVTLGRVPGGRDHLRLFYDRARAEMKRPIINSLFAARDEDGLIRIAERERTVLLRRHVLQRLQLLGTPKAKAYLEKVKW